MAEPSGEGLEDRCGAARHPSTPRSLYAARPSTPLVPHSMATAGSESWTQLGHMRPVRPCRRNTGHPRRTRTTCVLGSAPAAGPDVVRSRSPVAQHTTTPYAPNRPETAGVLSVDHDRADASGRSKIMRGFRLETGRLALTIMVSATGPRARARGSARAHIPPQPGDDVRRHRRAPRRRLPVPRPRR
jgi:hypothetical protein